MTTKLKLFGMAALLTSVMATPAHSATLYQSLSVDLILSYQAQATTNNKGVIEDAKGAVSLTTPKFLGVLATNLGTNLGRNAMLVKATTLSADGVNVTNFITNSTTNVPGYTPLLTVTNPTTIVWANSNYTLFATNSNPEEPSTNFPNLYFVTNFVTYIIQAKGDGVVVGTNVQYYLFNGGAGAFPADPSTDSRFVPLGGTNDNAGASIQALDDATNFLNYQVDESVSVDDPTGIYSGGTNYFGDYAYSSPLTNFFMAQLVTNLNGNVQGYSSGPIFVGTITTNLHITGTLYGDHISMSVGPPREAIGAPAPPNFSFISGSGSAKAVTANVGSGKSAMPFSSWNATFDVTGNGSLGGTITNFVTTNYSYVSNGFSFNIDYNNLNNYYGTIPPVLTGPNWYNGTNTIGYTNAYTFFYTNYSVINPTNTVFSVSGMVKQTFLKLIQ